MALPGPYTYNRHGLSRLDLSDPMDYYPDQLMIPVSRGARNLAAQYGLHPGQAGYTTQQLNGSTNAGAFYPSLFTCTIAITKAKAKKENKKN